MSGAVHAYVSQSDKGELVIGAGVDGYIGYGQRGSMQVTEQTLGAICELFPLFRRMRMLRQWGGIVDVCPTPDRTSPRRRRRTPNPNAAGAPEASKPQPAPAGPSPPPTTKATPPPNKKSTTCGTRGVQTGNT